MSHTTPAGPPAPVTRFAPSPTGHLHLGNVRTVLFNWLLARGSGGRFVLRVEDTDRERSREEFLASQLDDLAWLGLDWDAGPDRDDGRGPYRQSERGAIYAGLYERLDAAGLAYPCYCTPTELEVSRRAQLAAGRPPRYAGTCRVLDASARAARAQRGVVPTLRFRVPDDGAIEFDDLVRGPQRHALVEIGDFVIRRADGSAPFFFSNAVDDALMGIDTVLRGDDHLANTARQLLLLEALSLPRPRYGHLPLVLGASGAPLSKRDGVGGLRDLRAQGYLPRAVVNYLFRLGHSGGGDELLDLAGLAREFRTGRLGSAPAHFDAAQLRHWQREAAKTLDAEAFRGWLGAALGMPPAAPELAAVAAVARPNIVLPADAWTWLDVLGGDAPEPLPVDATCLAEAGPAFFRAALAAWEETGPELGALAAALRARTGRKGAALYMPLRVALTGRHDGPELAPLLRAIPPERVRARLAARAGLDRVAS